MPVTVEPLLEPAPSGNMPVFAVGDRVCQRGDPALVLEVLTVTDGKYGCRWTQDGQTYHESYYGDQLVAAPPV